MREVLCLHLNAHWGIKFLTGQKPSEVELPAGYEVGTQFEFRTWQPGERWNFEGPLPYRDIVVTASNFFLGKDGNEDPNAIALGVYDIVAVERVQPGDASRFSSEIGFDPSVQFAWVASNIRPFSTSVLQDPLLRVGATRGFYKAALPERFFQGLKPWQDWQSEELAHHRAELRKVLY